MPYKDLQKEKEASKERMRRYRKGVTKEGVTTQGVTQYHPILEALLDPVKRQKLEAICQALKRRNLGGELYYGCGRHAIDFNTVGELLDATH